VTHFEDLVDPGLVPQVDPVGDHPERRHRPALEEPADEALPLGTEDRWEEKEECERCVQGLPSQIEFGLMVNGNDGRPDMRDRPEADTGADPGDPREPTGPHPLDLLPVVMHPGAHRGQAHAEREEVQEGREPDGGQVEIGRVSVLVPEHDVAPGITDGDHRGQADQFDVHRPADGPARPTTPDKGGVQGYVQIERHLDAERPGGRDPLEILEWGVDLREQVVRGVGPPPSRTDAGPGVEDGSGHEEHEPVGGDDPQEPAQPECAGARFGCAG
jgi:hypothetical protein